MSNLQNLQSAYEASLRKAIGESVDFTIRESSGSATVSGAPRAVLLAVNFLVSNSLATLESSVFDDELCETFAYINLIVSE